MIERMSSLSFVHMGVAENGNMLIMVLSYTQQTGDTSLVKTYVSHITHSAVPYALRDVLTSPLSSTYSTSGRTS